MKFDAQFYKDALGWGFALWFIGYVLGIGLFAVVPISMIGWLITPIGIVITLWVLFRRVKSDVFQYYLLLSVCWTLIAIVFDYFFIVRLFKPVSGYYNADVLLYYVLTFALPLAAGWRKAKTN